jgi:hypothetical protein
MSMYDNELDVEWWNTETQEWEIWAKWATLGWCAILRQAHPHVAFRALDKTGLAVLEVH